MDEAGNPLKVGDVVVFPDTEVCGRDAAFGQDSGSLKRDKSGSALSTGTEVNQVPVTGEAVLGGVLAHGGNADAIGKGDRTQLERRKKRMAHERSAEKMKRGLRNG